MRTHERFRPGRPRVDRIRDDPVVDDDVELVRQYAERFLNAADGEGQAEAALDELEAIDARCSRNIPKFQQVLASAQVSGGREGPDPAEVFGERVSSVVLRFLRVLNRHGRLGLVRPSPGRPGRSGIAATSGSPSSSARPSRSIPGRSRRCAQQVAAMIFGHARSCTLRPTRR